MGKRGGGEGAELQLSAEPARVSVCRAERESAARGDVADLWIEAFGRVQDALEDAAALEVHQGPFETGMLGWRKALRLLLALAQQRFGARRRFLGLRHCCRREEAHDNPQ